ncbi:MAG: DASH family cryptochrome [Bdellovibrionia bacterium]
MRTLYFFTQDLRLQDNELWSRVFNESQEVCCVFYISPSLLKAHKYRQRFVYECFLELKKNLAKYNIPLVASCHSPDEIAQVMLESIDSFAIADDPGFYENELLKKLYALANHHQKKLFYDDVGSLFKQEQLPFSLEKLPPVFTDFRKKVEAQWAVPNLTLGPQATAKSSHLQIPELFIHEWQVPEMDQPRFRGGEVAGQERLHAYLWQTQSILSYKETRNGLLNFDDSSKFSPWLSTGALSPRQIYWEIKKFEESFTANESTYWLVFELLWREYFRLYTRKYNKGIFKLRGPFIRNKNYLPNRLAEQEFQKWISGQTGNDFIDANMLELNSTGYMSNRGRQNVASYLCKTMQVPWTWGAEYFEKMLVDYDVSSNWGNWNYVAGVGTDPRDRIFNADKQAQDYDPQGLYQKKWLNPKSEN